MPFRATCPVRVLIGAVAAAVLLVDPADAQVTDQYRAAARAYRDAAAKTTGRQRQCYLAFAAYHECLADSVQRGGGSCAEPTCLTSPDTDTAGQSPADPTSTGSYTGRYAAAQRALDEGFDGLRAILQRRAQDRARRRAAAERRADEDTRYENEMDQLRARMREEDAALRRAEREQRLREAEAGSILRSSDDILKAADQFGTDAPSPQGDALARKNGEGCTSGWEDGTFTITAWGNDRLWIRADALAFITDESGQPSFTGGYLDISHGSSARTHVYFGLSGTLNNELPPGGHTRIYLPIYRSKTDYRPTQIDIRARYCRD